MTIETLEGSAAASGTFSRQEASMRARRVGRYDGQRRDCLSRAETEVRVVAGGRSNVHQELR
jgi:hypothetical protein